MASADSLALFAAGAGFETSEDRRLFPTFLLYPPSERYCFTMRCFEPWCLTRATSVLQLKLGHCSHLKGGSVFPPSPCSRIL